MVADEILIFLFANSHALRKVLCVMGKKVSLFLYGNELRLVNHHSGEVQRFQLP